MRAVEVAVVSGEKEKRQGDKEVTQDKQVNGGGASPAETAAIHRQEEISL
jgi:hypothetical protein